MTEWMWCPKCGALMNEITIGHICPLCGYRVPDQTITTTTGTSVEYVPVIRCRDCKHREYTDESGTRWFGKYDQCGLSEDGFCAWAERVEE